MACDGTGTVGCHGCIECDHLRRRPMRTHQPSRYRPRRDPNAPREALMGPTRPQDWAQTIYPEPEF